MILRSRPSPALTIIYASAFCRSLGVGLTGVVLGIYLSRTGGSATFIGVVIAAGLAGAALGMVVVSFRADRLGRRRTLFALALFGAAGGLGFALTSEHRILLLCALTGMLNGIGTDRGPSFALEQAVIPQVTSADRRTLTLAWHSICLEVGHALGALGAILPSVFERRMGVGLAGSYRITFGVYAGLNLISAVLCLFLSSQVEPAREGSAARPEPVRISPKTKSIVIKLAALSGVDSLGGGFLSDALIAYWFFQRFGVSESTLGPLFFAGHLLNSASYLVAVWLARRIGLIKTMVFTHIPSSLFLMSVPFAPSFAWAVALLLAREALVEMDVPTRQSYVLGVVQPEERTYSSGITNLTRNVARATSPSFAGYFMQHLALASPLVLGGGLKVAYDLLLYWGFRRLKPPEEQAERVPGQAQEPRTEP